MEEHRDASFKLWVLKVLDGTSGLNYGSGNTIFQRDAIETISCSQLTATR